MHNKKSKKKLSKGSLIITGFLLICLSFFDLKADKSSISATSNNSIYTNVNASELINVMNTQSGLILIVDNKKDINRLISLLMDFEHNERIFVYNSKLDQIEFNDKCEIIKKPSNDFKRIMNVMGSYTELKKCTYNDEIIETDIKYIHTPMVIFVNNGEIVYSYFLPEEDMSEEKLTGAFEMGFDIFNNYN